MNDPKVYQILRRSGYTKDDALKLIAQGKVSAKGRIVNNPNFQSKKVEVDGVEVIELPRKYYIINKPCGYICHRKRSYGKKSIMELIDIDKKLKNTLHPVGRLDFNTSGLLLITNDGKLAIKILKPENEIEKEYEVTVNKNVTKTDIDQLVKGVEIVVDDEPYKTKPCKVKNVHDNKLHIIITEGKKRQVRLMMETLGLKVLVLKRVRIGKLKLDIPEGTYKEIELEEAKNIYA